MSGTGELGAMLRAWRDRVTPAQVGMAVNAPRRASGLRREELAVLAGISVDYLVRLEQSRAAAPSAQVCAALARALRLSDAEQDHLFRLAGHAEGDGLISRQVPASVRRLLEQLDDRPIGVYDAMWTLISWNRLWAALLGDPSALPEPDRNVAWHVFTGVAGRVAHSPEELAEFEASLVGDLREARGRYARDPRLGALVAELRRVSPRFAELWDGHAVGYHEQSVKSVIHPQVGPVEVDCDVLASRRGGLRVVIYTPRAGTDAQGKLDLVAAIGTQSMTLG